MVDNENPLSGGSRKAYNKPKLKPYSTPALVNYGDIHELTTGGSGDKPEGGDAKPNEFIT